MSKKVEINESKVVMLKEPHFKLLLTSVAIISFAMGWYWVKHQEKGALSVMPSSPLKRFQRLGSKDINISINNESKRTRFSKISISIQSSQAWGLMKVSENGQCQFSEPWVMVKKNFFKNIKNENHENSYSFQFKKNDGEISDCFVKSINHDNTAPTVSWDSEEAVEIVSDDQTVVKFTVKDNSENHGLKIKCQWPDSDVFVPCQSPVGIKGRVNLDGPFVVGVIAEDSAGNSSGPIYRTLHRDTKPPRLLMTQAPPKMNSERHPIFKFIGFDDGLGVVAFECLLPGEDVYTSCQSPLELSDLVAGPNALIVRAIDHAGNRSLSQEIAWEYRPGEYRSSITVDVKPGVRGSVLAMKVSKYSRGIAHAGPTYCKKNSEDMKECPSQIFWKSLAPGQNDFKISSHREGFDSSATAFSWFVDTEQPIIRPLALPEKVSFQKTADFSFRAIDPHPGSGIQRWSYQLDGGEEQSFKGAISLKSLSPGKHKLKVFAEDGMGNRSRPYMYSWTVSQERSPIHFISKPKDVLNGSPETLEFEIMGSYKIDCYIDGKKQNSCPSPINIGHFSEGDHIIEWVSRAKDGRSSFQEAFQWTIDRTGPQIQVTKNFGDALAIGEKGEVIFQVSDSSDQLVYLCTLNGKPVECEQRSQIPVFSSKDSPSFFTVVAKDKVGNYSIETLKWIVKDSDQETRQPAFSKGKK